MKSNCADIGAIQAFIDGELSAAETDVLTTHIADCDLCANQLAEAEEQTEMVYASLGRELDPLVPTQRLWSKINTALESERTEYSLWAKVKAFLAFPMANPSMSAAMAFLLVFGLAAALFMDRGTVNVPQPSDETVSRVEPQKPAINTPAVDLESVSRDNSESVVNEPAPITRASAPVAGGYRIERADIRQAAVPTRSVDPRSTASEFVISGEETYVKTIADMSRAVSGSSSDLMRPNEVIAYERNMAIVDDSISRLRKELRTNPKNDAAKQLLRSSYQNKIDLLNSVSQREELVAGLK